MKKLILLDWDGPVSNSRTWHVPHHVDPVAVQLLAQAWDNGWEVVLTSTIRKHYINAAQATEDFNKKGIHVQFFDDPKYWRTDPGFTTKRHLEFMQWYSEVEFDEPVVFLVIDDEDYPAVVTENIPLLQYDVSGDEGIGSRALRAFRDIICMNDDELAQAYGLDWDMPDTPEEVE